jgi:alkylation response protein AidB-like acyl-CoA dehydrogenase
MIRIDDFFPDAELANLQVGAGVADISPDWPATSWEALRAAGVLAWSVPVEFGGAGYSPVDLLKGAEFLGARCLTTAFILSQRDAAVRRLMAGPVCLKEKYLPLLALGTTFLTVGLSQLTTSRQHGGPALLASPTSGGYRLDGDVPWVTAADQAQAIIVGATLADGMQILVVVPTDRPGITIQPPMQLDALLGSRTCAVRCDGVEIEPELILAGPVKHILGKSGGGGLETSALALGLAGAAIDHIKNQANQRPEMMEIGNIFGIERVAARQRLHKISVATVHLAEAVLAARVECTDLALRATQAALLVAKGAGFVDSHPVGRWARQALFFLVWSCPWSVQAEMLTVLSGRKKG